MLALVHKIDPSLLSGSSIFFAEEIRSLEQRAVPFECYRYSCGGHLLWLTNSNWGWLNSGGETVRVDREFYDETLEYLLMFP